MKVHYFASPYSSKYPWVKWYRYYRTVKWGAYLIKKGFTLLEPISMCHWHSVFFNMPTGYKFWQSRDREFISRCDGIILLEIPGWHKSVGVNDELRYAFSLGKPVYLFNPDLIVLGLTKGRLHLFPKLRNVEDLEAYIKRNVDE